MQAFIFNQVKQTDITAFNKHIAGKSDHGPHHGSKENKCYHLHLLSGMYLGELVLKVKSMLAFNDIHYILPFPSCQVFTLLPVFSFQWFVTLKKKGV